MKKIACLPPMTTNATVGTDRVVRWIEVHPDYRTPAQNPA
jgi:hypothetical protein